MTKKSEMKTWNNSKGSGKLFSIDLVDSSKTEIRCAFFKEAAEKFFGSIEEGHVRDAL